MADRKVCTSCVKWCGDLYCFWRSPNLTGETPGPGRWITDPESGMHLFLFLASIREPPPSPVTWAEPPPRPIDIEWEEPRGH